MTQNPLRAFTAQDLQERVLYENFQDFCHELVELEASVRHPNSTVQGPARRFKGERGRDIQLTTREDPKLSAEDFRHGITGDHKGDTVFACKSGINWKDGLLEDSTKDAQVEVVKKGGHFTMLCNLALTLEERNGLLSGATRRLAEKTALDETEIKERVHLFDSTDLCNFFAYHAFLLSPDIRKSLGVEAIPGVFELEEWALYMRNDRGWPDFIGDAERDSLKDQIASLAGRSDETPSGIWFFGPPGVGKSRCIYESVRTIEAGTLRVYVFTGSQSALRALDESGLGKYSDAVIIFDECPANDARDLMSLFLARASGSRSTLILVGPQREDVDLKDFPSPYQILDPLEEKATKELISRELTSGQSPPEVIDLIWNLTEGYPWFSVLVARAVAEDPESLPVGSDEFRAADLAIMGRRPPAGADALAWDSQNTLRKKALLAVLLTEDLAWGNLDPVIRSGLEAALGATWSDLREAAVRCQERAIIRAELDWHFKYITPNNLGRIVATQLLTKTPGLVGDLRSNMQDLMPQFYARLEGLHVSPAVLGQLAGEELAPFLGASHQQSPNLKVLQFVARNRPRATANALRHLVERTPLDELRADSNTRRSIVSALEHLARRKGCFYDAEPALFRLALTENETWSNNATGIWKSLFLGFISLTWEPFDLRIRRLEYYLADPDEEIRLMALEGLDRAVSSEQVGAGYTQADKADGDWPWPSDEEVIEGKKRCWQMLCSVTKDRSPRVASRAQTIAKDNLRGAVRWHIGQAAIAEIQGVADGWTMSAQADLRQQIEEVRVYDSAWLNDEVEQSLRILEALVAPRDYHSRLLDAVGRWNLHKTEPGGIDAYEARTHSRLAADGLRLPDIPLIQELDWLDSSEAVRAAAFLVQVGRIDSDQLLAPHLVERALRGEAKETLAPYLAGLAESDSSVVDEVLTTLRSNPELALQTLLVTWRVGATPQRIVWIVDDLASRRLDPGYLSYLLYGGWANRVAPSDLTKLVLHLAGMDDVTALTTGLELFLALPRNAKRELKPVLTDYLTKIAVMDVRGMGAFSWQRGIELGVELGATEEVVRAAVSAVSSAESFEIRETAMKTLTSQSQQHPELVWSGLSEVLADDETFGFMFLFSSVTESLIASLPAKMILDWVGADVDRAVTIAGLCRLQSQELPEIVRELLMRFGSHGPVASELSARAGSTGGVVSSMAGFFRDQLDSSMIWAQDAHPAVAEWAAELAKGLERTYEREKAREEYEQKRRGG